MPKVTEKRKHLNAFYFGTERNTEDKTKDTNHMINKRMKNNMTEQSEKSCKSKVKSLHKLEQVHKSDDIVFIADASGVNLKLVDEEPKSSNSIKESVEQIVSFPSILLNSEGITSESMQFRNDTLKNVVNTKNPQASDKTIDLYQNMKKPLPSFMELEQILENNTDKLYSHKIKIPMKRPLFRIKEKDKISKSKQFLTKKQKNTEKKQINKTSSLISQPKQPIPSFTELEQMFEDNINDNFKSFHITEQECTFKSPKSLRTLVNDVIKLSTSRENSEKFATVEAFNIPVASGNLCLTSSNFHLNKLQQLQHNNSENYSLIDLESEETSKICNVLEKDANNTNYYNDDCCLFKQHTKHSPFKGNSVLLLDEKEKVPRIYPEITNDTSIDSLNDGSNESSKTVIYDYNTVSPNNNKLRPFSPIPSTSSDNETFLKNDIRFNESLLQNVSQDEIHTQSNVEVIEIPCETIILDDDTDNDNTCTDQTQLSIDDNEFPNNNYIKNYYDTINIDESFDNDCEIVDVDAVIDENNTILEKYRQNEMNKNNSCIFPNPKLTNSEIETETANDVRQKDSISNTTSRNEIADVVKNFFTNQPQSSYNSLPHHTSANKSSVPANDFLKKTTRSVIKAFITQNSHTEVPQARHTTLNICDNVDIVTLDDTASQNNDSSDDIVVVSSTPPTWRSVPATVDSNRNMNNIHSRNGSMGLNSNTLVTNRHISNDKNSISKTTGVINKRSAPAPTTPKVHNVGDCPICLENLLNVNIVASTNCGHMFCMKCIKTALKSSGRRCPTCRKILKGPGYHQLFFT